MKYLVTGGAGFIGSHIAEELVREGHDVTIVDDLSTGKLSNIFPFEDKVNLVQGDIRDYDLMRKATQGIDIVFHEAAIASVAKSVEDPVATDAINVGGTVSVLTAAKECGVKKVVFASSAAIYGDDPELPKREDMAPKPLSPYAFISWRENITCGYFINSTACKAWRCATSTCLARGRTRNRNTAA